MGIASLCEVHDHEPIWAHYADQFRGMCVKYSLRRLLNGLSNKISVTRMMYPEVEPVLLNEKSMSADRDRLCLSSKSVRWANEREWRIFSLEKGKAEYEEMKTIARIYLGSRISPGDESRIRAAGATLSVPVAKMAVAA